ncbi:hypothetical protein C9374_009099 [Naegleria lovaniensis]|uniref:Uncharacterized protein n=1 Tax=Naegleria lovaniensis TaxID=51637 RepID=A0AA88GFI2_NAELO|nr:uncharacterized protein C9374_009099 [Naegleria lovaniensis]KAG2377583.1 hypothetical protein C9374_009099 [Naegleria lovaniensis]
MKLQQPQFLYARLCSGAELIDKETYMKLYDHYRWNDRRTQDVKRFKYAEKVATQSNIYSEPRATNDIRAADNNPNIKTMTETSIIRAIKFCTRRSLTCRISKGFRCTPLVVSAAILSPIVTPTQHLVKFTSIKTLKDCQHYLVDNWEQTKEGQLLLEEEYDELFLDGAFSIDARFALPKDLLGRLESSKFSIVGMFSYYNKSVIACTLFE